MFPHERRAHVETRLQALPENFVGLHVESRFNRVGNCHRLILMPGVLLTVSAVPTPSRMVRPNKHRKLYASGAAGNIDFRQSFFMVDDHNKFMIGRHDTAILKQGLIYGVVFYSPAEDNPLGVGSVGIGFPDARYRRYVETLNLTKMFSRLSAPTVVEQVEDLAKVELLLRDSEAEGVSSLFQDGGG